MSKYAVVLIIAFCLPCCITAQEEDEPGIIIESRHIVLEMADAELHITDAIMVNIQSSDGNEELLTYSIPAGYTRFEIHNGLDPDSLIFQEDRIIDARHLPAGKIPIAFKYALPISRNTVILPFYAYNETRVFYFLVKNLELDISSNELLDEGMIEMGERSFHAFSAVGLRQGEELVITIAGMEKRARRNQVLIFAAVVALILIVIVVFVFRKGRGERLSGDEQDDLLSGKRKMLAATIALLDEKHEKGEIGDAAYQRLRKEYSAQLRRIIEEIEGPESDPD